MDVLVYIITRDNEAYERDISDSCVCVWQLGREIVLDYEQFPGNRTEGAWVDKTGDMPLHELTPEEFKDRFHMDPPKPGGKFMIGTVCAWEKLASYEKLRPFNSFRAGEEE